MGGEAGKPSLTQLGSCLVHGCFNPRWAPSSDLLLFLCEERLNLGPSWLLGKLASWESPEAGALPVWFSQKPPQSP